MTEIFLDTANLDDIKEIKRWGLMKGITTNQKIFCNEKGCNFEKQAKKILDLVRPLPVSIEGPNNYDDLIEAAKEYNEWAPNVVIKVPMLGNGDGIRAVETLFRLDIKTNVTACITLNQAFLAASAGATYVSLFYNRMKDWREDDCMYADETIHETMKMLKEYETELIVGSIRKPEDVESILKCGPDIITIPTKILKQMPQNEMTEKTLKEFDEAWNEFLRAEKK
jgi:transaldolase